MWQPQPMEFFTFLEKEAKALDRRLLILGALAAMINLFLLFALTAAATKALQHEPMLWELTVVAIGLFSYWISEGFVLRRMTVAVEGIVEKVRLRIAEKIRYADLTSVEIIGKAPVYNAVSTHALNLSRGASGIITGFTSLALLCWASLIILILSGTAFLILAATVALVIVLFNANQAKMNAWMKASVNQDNRFLGGFGDMIDGFKELKMNSAKADDFIESSLRPLAASARELRTQAGLTLNRSILLATLGLFIVLAALVFLLPLFSPDQVSNLPGSSLLSCLSSALSVRSSGFTLCSTRRLPQLEKSNASRNFLIRFMRRDWQNPFLKWLRRSPSIAPVQRSDLQLPG